MKGKKLILPWLLSAAMVISMAPAAFATDSGDAPEKTGAMSSEKFSEPLSADELKAAGIDLSGGMTNQEAVSKLLHWAGMTDKQLGQYPSDTNAMAESMGMTKGIRDYDPEATVTKENIDEMTPAVCQLKNALHPENGKMKPLFMNGMAQPIFPYTSGAVEKGYSNDKSDIIRYCVYVETDYDTDNDGNRDLVKAVVQIPRAAAEGDYKASTIYEARPYIPGCTPFYGDESVYGKDGYDISKLDSRPAARKASSKPVSTMKAAENARSSDWYYYNRYEDLWDYEDLTWYDNFLVRGYAVVETGGIGTRGSEGFETCGDYHQVEAFKDVIEWLHGDRVAYTDKTSNIPVTADWSNGNVGMTGRSYAGTTQFGLATTGVEGLRTIVPVAGIASWYEYTNSQGVPTDSASHYTDILGLYCAGRYIDKEDWKKISRDYGNYLAQTKNDQEATNGDYSNHWKIRDYTKDAEKIKCPALIVHGLNDNNVRTKEFDLMYRAYKKAGAPVKLLLHQDAHITPAYPSSGLEFNIGDTSYDDILNRWFSHYLYGVDNGIEKMAEVTAQSSSDTDKWTTYDSWEAAGNLVLNGKADSKDTVISSDYAGNGMTRSNYQEQMSQGSTPVNARYVADIDKDTTLKGSVAVKFSASASNAGDSDSQDKAEVRAPRGNKSAGTFDHDNYVNPDKHESAKSSGADVKAASDGSASGKAENIEDRDGLMVSAMLVDLSDKAFPAFNTEGSYVPKAVVKEKGAWQGGGLENLDLVKLQAKDVNYKVIARGWMDLCNPGAGYDSASADSSTRISLKPGESHDYTIYLQPNLYEVKAGHKLALVIYTYDPSLTSYDQDYKVTIDNSSVSAVIPVDQESMAGSVNAVYSQSQKPDTVKLSVSTEGRGNVRSSAGTGNILKNSKTTLTANPAEGYSFDHWIVNGENKGDDRRLSVSLDSDTEVKAVFTGTDWSNPYKDVSEGDWFYDAAAYTNRRNIMTGTAADKFDPQLKTTRAMLISLIYRMEGSPSADAQTAFKDVHPGSWYESAIKWASANKIVSGYDSSTFGPDDPVTREQLAAILYRYAAYKGYDTSKTGMTQGFTDAANVSEYAVPAMNWAVNSYIINGIDSELQPQAAATRAQTAEMIMNFMTNVAG